MVIISTLWELRKGSNRGEHVVFRFLTRDFHKKFKLNYRKNSNFPPVFPFNYLIVFKSTNLFLTSLKSEVKGRTSFVYIFSIWGKASMLNTRNKLFFFFRYCSAVEYLKFSIYFRNNVFSLLQSFASMLKRKRKKSTNL